MDIDERLSKIEGIIRQPSFLNNEETGNEIGYYIFDYDPKFELLVRNEIKRLKDKINDMRSHFKTSIPRLIQQLLNE